ncbi:MAG: hypothetical protein RMY28_014365 [Nostoc sp. ChiSLP01]|nr:hypothetical protein [Nostoc sp. CmiSLP01]MDZ8286420.1 hypothetical protein [Nostoc sp. ChiSLP01]
MKVKGIKRDRTIEFLEQINNIPDGTEIIVELEVTPIQIIAPQQPLTEAQRLAKLHQLFGTWKNQPELTEIFTEIDEQRHAYQGRTINSIDNEDNE